MSERQNPSLCSTCLTSLPAFSDDPAQPHDIVMALPPSIEDWASFSSHSALSQHDFLTQLLEQSFSCFTEQAWLAIEERLDAIGLQKWASALVEGF